MAHGMWGLEEALMCRSDVKNGWGKRKERRGRLKMEGRGLGDQGCHSLRSASSAHLVVYDLCLPSSCLCGVRLTVVDRYGNESTFHSFSSLTAGFDSMKLRSTLCPNSALILFTPYLQHCQLTASIHKLHHLLDHSRPLQT
jgi:hypothetical protein